MDQFVERESEINFDKGAVPSGKKVSTTTSEKSFDISINKSERTKKDLRPSISIDQFEFDREQNDENSHEFKARLQEFRERVNSNAQE